ncbi:Nuclear ATP/GTP-binding protein [Giardia muris]|uniref:Nuclear ATP/GTP-binding protein n=1 Tax=Giardia muris TaxID=5742 RepID=A0A4Z1SZT2_GIAMU|nr:Nuclear ATP/GTP-binding protein [Giardia muris]|eukprot:TNJ28968.1 Nuclear ATP/GTP-binding protein [Giardia muris]
MRPTSIKGTQRLTARTYGEIGRLISEQLAASGQLPAPPDPLYDAGPKPKEFSISTCGFVFQEKTPPIVMPSDGSAFDTEEPERVPAPLDPAQRQFSELIPHSISCCCGCTSLRGIPLAGAVYAQLQKGQRVFHYKREFSGVQQPHPESGFSWWKPLLPDHILQQDEYYRLTHNTVSRLYNTNPSFTSLLDRPQIRHTGVGLLSGTAAKNVPGDQRRVWSEMLRDSENIYSTAGTTRRIELKDSSLRFESRFESGNLMQATRISICTAQIAPLLVSDRIFENICPQGQKDGGMDPGLESTRAPSNADPSNPYALTRPYTIDFQTNDAGMTTRFQPYDQHYFLLLRPDTNSTGNTQWYYFAVGNTIPGIRYTFFISNFTKSTSQYSEGMQPVVFSETEYMLTGTGWTRGGYDIWYAGNNAFMGDKHGGGGGLLGNYYTLSFSYTFRYASDIVYFAHTYPYPYTQAQLWLNKTVLVNAEERKTLNSGLNRIITDTLLNARVQDVDYQFAYLEAYRAMQKLRPDFLPTLRRLRESRAYRQLATLVGAPDYQNASVPMLNHRVICHSVGQNDVDMLTITAPSRSTEELQARRVVVVSARIHPGEAQSSYVCQGFVDFILSKAPIAELLRRLYVFRIFPLVNPDGVILGNYRCNLAGADLNRRYAAPSNLIHPSIYAIKRCVQTLIDASTGDTTSSAMNSTLGVKADSGEQDSDGGSHGASSTISSRPGSAKGLQRKSRPTSSGPVVPRPFTSRIAASIDLHGHSKKTNAFGYACYGDGDGEEVAYFKLLNRISQYFSLRDCRFSIGRCKEGTQRAVSYNLLRIKHSYCIEATFGGVTKAGSTKCGIQMDQQDFLQLGKDLAIGLLALHPELLSAAAEFNESVGTELHAIIHSAELKAFVLEHFSPTSILSRLDSFPPSLRITNEAVLQSVLHGPMANPEAGLDAQAEDLFLTSPRAISGKHVTRPYSRSTSPTSHLIAAIPYRYTLDMLNEDAFLLRQIRALSEYNFDAVLVSQKSTTSELDGQSSDDDIKVEFARAVSKRRKSTIGIEQAVDHVAREMLQAQKNEARMECAFEAELTNTGGVDVPMSVRKNGKVVYKLTPPAQETPQAAPPPPTQKPKPSKSCPAMPKLAQVRRPHNQDRELVSAACAEIASLIKGEEVELPEFKTCWGNRRPAPCAPILPLDERLRQIGPTPSIVRPPPKPETQELVRGNRLATYSLVKHELGTSRADRAEPFSVRLSGGLTTTKPWKVQTNVQEEPIIVPRRPISGMRRSLSQSSGARRGPRGLVEALSVSAERNPFRNDDTKKK